jgi:hypothetical protein
MHGAVVQCAWTNKDRRCGYACHVTCAQRENLAMVILTEAYSRNKQPSLPIYCPEHEPVRASTHTHTHTHTRGREREISVGTCLRAVRLCTCLPVSCVCAFVDEGAWLYSVLRQALVPVHAELRSSLLRDHCRQYKQQGSATGALKRTTTVPLHSVCRCHQGEGPLAQSRARPPINGNAAGVGFYPLTLPPTEAAKTATWTARHGQGRACQGCGTTGSLFWWSARDLAATAAAAHAAVPGAGDTHTNSSVGGGPEPHRHHYHYHGDDDDDHDNTHYCQNCYWDAREGTAMAVDDANA